MFALLLKIGDEPPKRLELAVEMFLLRRHLQVLLVCSQILLIWSHAFPPPWVGVVRRRKGNHPTACPPWRDGNRRRAYPDIHAECEPTGVGMGCRGHGAGFREFGSALFQRPTRSGEDADARIYWNLPG